MKRGKKYQTVLKEFDPKKIYSFEEAVPLLKKTSTTKFDSTIDISFRLNVNPTLADQLIRGTLVLPHGNGKVKRVLAVTNTKQEEAKSAGADFVGGKERLNRLGGYPFFSPGRDGLFSGAEGGFRLTESGAVVYYVSERKMKEFYQ